MHSARRQCTQEMARARGVVTPSLHAQPGWDRATDQDRQPIGGLRAMPLSRPDTPATSSANMHIQVIVDIPRDIIYSGQVQSGRTAREQQRASAQDEREPAA